MTAEPRPAINRNALIAAALAAVALLAYAQTVNGQFEFLNVDDDEYVTANPLVQAGLTAESVRWAFTTDHAFNWHPLTWLSLQLDATLWSMDPRGFHLTNILLHAANTALLFTLLNRMTKAKRPSSAAAALFALHPTHVESVAWITERKDVLSTLFWLLTTLAYAWYTERPGVSRYTVMLILFALGLMAKPMLVTLPATLLLLDCWPLRRWPNATSIGRLILEKLPMFLMVAASVWLTIQAQKAAIRTFDQLPMSTRLANAAVSYADYLGMLFWPSDLAVFYPHPAGGIQGMKIAVAALVLLTITAAAFALARSRPYLIVGWLWYLGTLVPVVGIMQVGIHALADRYTYVPYIGLSLMLAWGIADIAGRWPWSARPIAALSIAALVACFALTWRQASFWRDSVTLWERTIAVTETNPLAHEYLARELMRRGEFAGAAEHLRAALTMMPRAAWMHGNLGLALERLDKPDEAAAEFEQALRLDPKAQDAEVCHAGLGRVRESQGRFEKARDHLTEALRLNPASASTRFHLGRVLYRLGRLEDALAEFEAALARRPDVADVHNHRGVVLEEMNRMPEALAAYNQAVKLEPGDYVFRCNLAYALHAADKAGAAAKQYREALRIKPDWPQLAMELAWQKATHPDHARRDGKQALRTATQACQATSYRQPQALDVLAAACAELGRFEEAVTYERQAITLLTTTRSKEGLAEAQERLALYEKRKPFREGTP